MVLKKKYFTKLLYGIEKSSIISQHFWFEKQIFGQKNLKIAHLVG